MRGRDPQDAGAIVEAAPRRALAHLTGAAGYTLLEVLLSVLLVGIVVLGIAAGLLTLVRSTNHTSDAQELQVALDNWSENLKAFQYLPCAGPEDYETAYAEWPGAWTPPAGLDVTLEIARVRHWHKGPRDASGELVAGPGFYDAACYERDGDPLDEGAQLLTLRVERAGEAREATIVKAVR